MDDGRNILSDDRAKTLLEVIEEWETGRVFAIPARRNGKTAAMKAALERATEQAQQIKQHLTAVRLTPDRAELLLGAKLNTKRGGKGMNENKKQSAAYWMERMKATAREAWENLKDTEEYKAAVDQAKRAERRPLTIAVDFDGTLVENAWPEIGETRLDVLTAVKAAKAAGAKLILWTNRVGARLNDAVEWCRERGLEFDAVNENLPEVLAAFITDTRKIVADIYLDDKAVPPYPAQLSAMVHAAEQRRVPEKKPEATVVTTLTVTHILRDCTADRAAEWAEMLAQTARDAAEAGYQERVLPKGHPDDICVSGVQVFGFDGEQEGAAE